MSRVADDLCSTVSTISSAFTEFDDDGGDAEDSLESPEMKYIPPVIKLEPVEDPGNITEEDVDDAFIKRYISDDEEECTTPPPNGSKRGGGGGRTSGAAGGMSSGDTPRSSRSTPRKAAVPKREKLYAESDEEGDNEKDQNWSPDEEEDEWAPKNSKKKRAPVRKSVSKRNAGSSSGPKPRGRVKLDPEEKKKREQERKKAFRRRNKEMQSASGNAGGSGSSNSKGRVTLTPEERKEKERERKRAFRRREKELKSLQTLVEDDIKVKSEFSGLDKSEESDTSRSSSRTSGGRQRNRKRVSEMTPEELKAHQEKWERERELRKARRARLPPEKIEEQRIKSRERLRLRRAKAKQGLLPEDQARRIEEQKEKDRERKRRRRAAMTEEQKREEAQKTEMYRLSRLARMSDQEKKERQMKAYMERMARLAEMTPEEREALAEKKRVVGREKARIRLQKLRESLGAEELRERKRNYYHGMDAEQKAKHLARQREYHRKKMEKLKQDPEKWKEVLQEYKDRRLRLLERLKEGGDAAVRRRRLKIPTVKTESESQPRRRKWQGSSRKWSEMTEEHKEKFRQYRRERDLKKKLAIQVLLDSGMTMEEIKQRTETPEKRERRCILARIRKARADLRNRLKRVGATPEEIKQREEELKRNYQPTPVFRPYKPQPERWKRVHPTDIAKLEAEGKLEEFEKCEPEVLLEKIIMPQKTRPHSKSAYKGPATTCPQPPELSSPPSPPRKRGRPMKYPLKLQASSSSSSSSAVIPKSTDTFITHLTAPPVQQQQPQQSSPISMTTTSYPQQQQHYPNYGAATTSSSYYPPHHSSQPGFLYPHLQPQVPPPQPYSLQNVLDAIGFHDTSAPTTSTSAVGYGHQASSYQQHQDHSTTSSQHHHDHSTTSSQHEYGSSYHGDDGDYNNYSPPASPGGGDDGDFDPSYNYSAYTQSQAQPQQQNQPPQQTHSVPRQSRSTGPGGKRGPAKKKVRKYRYVPPKNPNAKLRTRRHDPCRNVVCDECGQNFVNSRSLGVHQKQLHNPDYDVANRLCRVCGETFKHAQVWYSHYVNVHARPNRVISGKTHMCDECGQGYSNKHNLEKHQYYMHGDGLKPENHLRCPVCPDEKLFKEKMNLNAHLERYHPGYGQIHNKRECYRCDVAFPSDPLLRDHVKLVHPESYFPCEFCTATRFTKLGLRLHYRRCTKIPKEEKATVRWKYKCEGGNYGIEDMTLACELCDRKMTLSRLIYHYRDCHNVKEDPFVCEHCNKSFKRREFWAVHLEERHMKPVEEMSDYLRKLNAQNRNGMSAVALFGGRPAEKRRRYFLFAKKAKKKAVSDSEDDEDEEWVGGGSVVKMALSKMKKKKRRNVIVIAEEDEVDNMSE